MNCFVKLAAAWLLSGVACPAWTPERPSPPEPAAANLPAHRLGPNDLVSVTVYDSPELSRQVRVDSEGNVRLPLLRDAVRAAGLLPSELETSLAGALGKEKLLVSPVVSVAVAEYHSRFISVAGAVKNPSTIQALGSMRLLDAIARCGGLTENAGAEILVTPAGEEGLVRRIGVHALLNASDPSANIPLQGGEQIRVPELGKIYVVGNVRRPGAFQVRDTAKTTVLQVIALAEGLAQFAEKKAFLYRDNDEGKRVEIPVPLAEILQRKVPDIPVQPHDVLYIPDSKARRVTMTALERILTFGSTAGASALIYNGMRP